MAHQDPLILDVDGTFLKTDMLLESFWRGMGRAPIQTLQAAASYAGDRAKLKQVLAELAQPRVDLMPVNDDILSLARAAQEDGREVILASASDKSLVEALADTHHLSERVFASDGTLNLKAQAKSDALVQEFGSKRFDYAGNDVADLAVWPEARRALIVGDVRGADKLDNASFLPGGWAWADVLRALRPHQWVKNVLLLMPLIAAHEFGLTAFLLILFGFIAFSAAASCIYIVNDLLDLEADRLHATKCRRPFASGAVPIKIGMAVCLGLGVLALGLAAMLGIAFLGVIVVYMTLSLAYSLKLKRLRWVDIATLAALYTLRVVAGAAAAEVNVTGYMLVFIFPVFVTLGCVKRLTELTLAKDDNPLPGRGYGRKDRGDLLNVAGLGMFGALMVFFLYTFTEHAIGLYPTRWLLWLAMIPMTAWLWRMVALGYTGKQDYDPIVFAMRDKLGLALLVSLLTVMFHAAGLFYDAFGF